MRLGQDEFRGNVDRISEFAGKQDSQAKPEIVPVGMAFLVSSAIPAEGKDESAVDTQTIEAWNEMTA